MKCFLIWMIRHVIFDEIDAFETARYNQISKEGAQEYVKRMDRKG